MPNEPLQTVFPQPWVLASDHQFIYQTPDGTVPWQVAEYDETPNARRTVYKASGLELTVTCTARPEHGAFVCRQTLKNTSAADCTLDRLQPLHIVWTPAGGPAHIRTTGGGLNQHNYPPDTFRLETVRGDEKAQVWMENAWDGRSSGTKLPLMTVCCGEHSVTAGLEWSGLWWMDGEASADGPCRISCHIPVRGLKLAPGETLEMPAAHYVFAHGGLEGASAAIRRYIRECVVPPRCGARIRPQVTYNHWFGIGPEINEQVIREQFAKAADLGVSYAVLDAGWYGGCAKGDFGTGVGNWDLVDEEKFPEGLEPVSAFAREKGLKFGLWFEVERAHRQSGWVREHPEWFMDIGREFLHIDMSCEAAVDACIGVVQKAIDAWGLEWVKLDYNIGPKPFWDKVDPTGKIQFAYMRGLYRFYDTLRENNPSLVIENCASGGRRIDLGTMAHTHIQNLTDQTASPEICRYTVIGAGYFLPPSIGPIGLPFGTAEIGHRADSPSALRAYDVLCRFAGLPVLYGDIASLDESDTRTLRDMIALYETHVAGLLDGTLYHLTDQPWSDHAPEAVLFVAPDGNEALLLAYAGYEGADGEHALRLMGLRADATYSVTSLLAEANDDMKTGWELMDEGLRCALPARSCVAVKCTLVAD